MVGRDGLEEWKESERSSSNAVRKTTRTARCRYLAVKVGTGIRGSAAIGAKWRLNGSFAASTGRPLTFPNTFYLVS